MLDLLLATLLLALSTLPGPMEEWRQCLLVEAPEIHMLLHEALRERMATEADTAGMVDSEVREAVMAVEVVDLWALLLLLATGDVVRDPVLTAEEAVTEVAEAAISGIWQVKSTMVPFGHPMGVYRALVELPSTRSNLSARL